MKPFKKIPVWLVGAERNGIFFFFFKYQCFSSSVKVLDLSRHDE